MKQTVLNFGRHFLRGAGPKKEAEKTAVGKKPALDKKESKRKPVGDEMTEALTSSQSTEEEKQEVPRTSKRTKKTDTSNS